MKKLSLAKKICVLFVALGAFCRAAQAREFYWESPELVSSAEAMSPKSVSNGTQTYGFWQEIDSARHQIFLSVRYMLPDGTWSTNSRFAGPFSYAGEIPDLYSASLSSSGTVVVSVLSSANRISAYVSEDKCRSFRRFDFAEEDGEFLAPRVFARRDGSFMLFCSLARETSVGASAILTHNFYLYAAHSADGITWSPFRQIFGSEKYRNSFSPVLASAPDGDYLIFQSQSQKKDFMTYQLFCSVSENGGELWTEPFLITGENSFEEKETEPYRYDNQLPFAFCYDGDVHVVWERNSPGSENTRICYERLDKRGVVPRSAESVSQDGSSRGASLFAVDGTLYVSWYARSGGRDSIFYAQKDGFSWRKDSIDTERNSARNPCPLFTEDTFALLWQETYGADKSRIRFLSPDKTCAPAQLSSDSYKTGSRSKSKKLRVKVRLPEDSSGVDGYVYSWSLDGTSAPDLDENALSYPNSTVLNLTADAEGYWTLRANVLDRAGNWSKEAVFSYFLDLTPPRAVIVEYPSVSDPAFLNSNTFSVRWSPSPLDSDVYGYSYEISKICGIQKKYAGTPRHPMKASNRELNDYGAKLVDANRRALERPKKLSESIKTKLSSAQFRNLDNGLYVFTVAAVDEAGHLGEAVSVPILLNRYVPATRIDRISKDESLFGDVKIDIFGDDFLTDGTITHVIVDKDGEEPWDLEVDAQKGGYKVPSNGKIEGVHLGSDLFEGSYFVGVVHSDRGLCMTKNPALNILKTGTVKIENEYDYRPRWRTVSRTYSFRLYMGSVLLAVILLLCALGMVVFGIEFIKNCAEWYSARRIIEQVSKGELMDVYSSENKKRSGTLKVSLAGFTISLVVFIIVLLSVILGTSMIRSQNRTLSRGLHERVNVLLSSLSTGARSYLPSADVLELSQLPRQMESLGEAEFVTISGLPEGGDAKDRSLLYVWASNDGAITEKIDVLNQRKTSFVPGVSLISKNAEQELEALEKCLAVNDEAVKNCASFLTLLSAYNTERQKAGEARRAEINEAMQQVNVQLNGALTELAAKSAGSIPEYNDEALDSSVTDYLFYRPVLYRSGLSTDFVRGIVFIKVNTSTLHQEIERTTKIIMITILIIALFAIGVGIIASVIFAAHMVRPIKRLETAVKAISEENNKELLLRNELTELPNNEIGRLGDSVNKMQHDLGFNARELNLQLNASEIQQGLVPLEPLAGNVKQNVSRICDGAVREFAYYKGAAGVSGDYFDFKKLDDRFYVVVKCDASGHAAPAGILVTIIATLYKKWFEAWTFAKNGTRLEEFVYKANDFLEALNIKGKFVAMMICLYDSKTGTAYMSHAGDRLFRVYSQETGILSKHELAESPALGPFPSFMVEMKGGFTVEKIALHQRDILLLYTDGIEENGRAKRKADFSAVLKPKLNSDGEQVTDDFGNLEWEIDKEEFGEERVREICEAVFHKQKYVLTKEQNPSIGERLELDFTTCEGTIEECILALASCEKLFRLYKPLTAGAKDWVEVDTAIDGFLKAHFNLYEQYAIPAVNEKGETEKPKNPNYVYYAYCKEDVQEDDLTVIAIQRP